VTEVKAALYIVASNVEISLLEADFPFISFAMCWQVFRSSSRSAAAEDRDGHIMR
jgi:hypothetical protein